MIPIPAKQRRKPGCSKFLFLLSALFLLFTAALTVLPRLDSRHRIVIDPGHGGYDVGAVGLIEETALTETTAGKLAALLEEDGRFRVFLTRELGSSATLADRCRTARRHRADLMLSIHGNAAEDPSASGFECYPAPPGRPHHAESLRFASLLTARMAEAGASLRGENGIRYAYFDEAGVRSFTESSDLTLRAESSFAVVDSSGCPSVLAEQCFITNAADIAAFGDEDGCAKAATAYYLAILDHFGQEPLS